LDEAQWEVCESLVDVKTFETEDERIAFVNMLDKPIGDNTMFEGKPAIFYSRVGELAKQAAKQASEYYKLRVSLDADYIIGKDWAECH